VDLLKMARPLTPTELRPHRRPYLIALGTPGVVTPTALQDYYDAWLGLKVETLPDARLDPQAFDSGRGQYVAEDLIASLRRALPELAADPCVTVIAITEADMYIRAYPWRFAFNYRGGQGFAVVSSARMVPWLYRLRGKEYLLQTRLRKMISATGSRRRPPTSSSSRSSGPGSSTSRDCRRATPTSTRRMPGRSVTGRTLASVPRRRRPVARRRGQRDLRQLRRRVAGSANDRTHRWGWEGRRRGLDSVRSR
jgi:hypothetical protein